jgi:hypothetical protein
MAAGVANAASNNHAAANGGLNRRGMIFSGCLSGRGGQAVTLRPRPIGSKRGGTPPVSRLRRNRGPMPRTEPSESCYDESLVGA